ncbi:MAG: CBS domain-containing protein [Deltaproteobacteria bacterium]|nr:CBS domain-containing protein [Deltaproteobacteria bacterium]
MNCNDIMKKAVLFLNRDDTVQAAAKLMADANIGFLPVCDSGKCIGTLTDRDIVLRLVCFDRPASTRVGDIMTHDVVACSPWDSVETAAQTMADNQVSRLLINDEDGRLVGIISLSDLPRASAEKAFEAFREISERESAPSSP